MSNIHDKTKRCCGNCTHWQDFEDRVSACISKGHSNTARNLIELRCCKYDPPPQVDVTWRSIYTDEYYVCSGFDNCHEKKDK